ncbi:MAG: hypothetical protein HY220_04385 [Candidatus Sungbacteria bacterium]|uniref:Nucleotidase n=1 Tax=Candidatus Sungiibacteriota bacterium TaxID=2750080 RepID=A0A9D6LQV9_9BACT|nr:hypothetical protein [Candidatus Sungbacteria bacterium]
MEKQKIIGIDLDDVLLDFNGALCEFHNAIYGTSYSRKDILSYDLENTWGCSRDDAIRRILEFYNSDVHYNAQPVEGATEAVRELSKNYLLVVITSKPSYLAERTTSWLEKYYSGLFSGVYFTNQFHGDGIKRTKAGVCNELGVEIFIDDSVAHALEVADTGRKVWLFNTPWNQDPIPSHITRVYSWTDVLEHIRNER